eukprot:2811286-Pyramimonas_sp.AAC.1
MGRPGRPGLRPCRGPSIWSACPSRLPMAGEAGVCYRAGGGREVADPWSLSGAGHMVTRVQFDCPLGAELPHGHSHGVA